MSVPESCSRSKALSTASGLGWKYRCDTMTLQGPAIRMIVKASSPNSPSLDNIVWAQSVNHKVLGRLEGGSDVRVKITCVSLVEKHPDVVVAPKVFPINSLQISKLVDNAAVETSPIRNRESSRVFRATPRSIQVQGTSSESMRQPVNGLRREYIIGLLRAVEGNSRGRRDT
jgi:hypothetical protein